MPTKSISTLWFLVVGATYGCVKMCMLGRGRIQAIPPPPVPTTLCLSIFILWLSYLRVCVGPKPQQLLVCSMPPSLGSCCDSWTAHERAKAHVFLSSTLCIFVCVYVCLYVYLYVGVFVCMCICMYGCMCVYLYRLVPSFFAPYIPLLCVDAVTRCHTLSHPYSDT